MAELIYMIREDFKFSEMGRRYYYNGEVTDGTSKPIRVPTDQEKPVIVHVNPGTSALVQYTLSPDRAIELDQAIWIDWPLREVTELTVDYAIGNIIALRLVATGTAVWEIVV